MITTTSPARPRSCRSACPGSAPAPPRPGSPRWAGSTAPRPPSAAPSTRPRPHLLTRHPVITADQTQTNSRVQDVLKQPRQPPPSYEEAQQQQRSPCPAERGGPVRSRPLHPSPQRRPGPALARAPAQDIPDIYWEQAARELDFCTCRKCQARYRQVRYSSVHTWQIFLTDEAVLFSIQVN